MSCFKKVFTTLSSKSTDKTRKSFGHFVAFKLLFNSPELPPKECLDDKATPTFNSFLLTSLINLPSTVKV